MATKSGQQEPEKAEAVEDLLDALDAALDRVKLLYEQYFLGIQRQPPTYLHTDAERKIRDLAQRQVRNTALRYRFATLQQKFGSYNAYWRRTLRRIENGTYPRNLSKIGRQAAKTGAAVPEEILAAMPKRMRDQIKRDREAVLALAELRNQHAGEPELLTLGAEDAGSGADVDVDDLDPAALIHESTGLHHNAPTTGGAHESEHMSEHKIDDADFDLDAFFAAVTSEDEPAAPGSPGDAAAAAAPVAQPSGSTGDPPPAVPPPVVAVPAPWPPGRPDPVKPPALAPSQLTPPPPVTPGPAAARAPAAVEAFAGPLPRIPSLPPQLTRRRAEGEPPAAAAQAPATEPPPVQAADGAAASHPTAKPKP